MEVGRYGRRREGWREGEMEGGSDERMEVRGDGGRQIEGEMDGGRDRGRER